MLLLLGLSLIFKHFYGCLLILFLPLSSFAAYFLLFSPWPKTYLQTSPYSLNHFFAPSLSLPLPFCFLPLLFFGLRLCLLFISDSTPMCHLPHLCPQQTPHHPLSSSWHPLYPKYCSLIGHLEQNAVWNIKWKGLWEKKMIYPSQTQTVRWNEETEPFPKINLIWMIDFCGVSYLLGICSNPTLFMINVDCQAPKPLVPKTPNQVPIRSKTKRDWAGWGWHLNAVGHHRPLPPPPPM